MQFAMLSENDSTELICANVYRRRVIRKSFDSAHEHTPHTASTPQKRPNMLANVACTPTHAQMCRMCSGER